jgi:hypothetical protein
MTTFCPYCREKNGNHWSTCRKYITPSPLPIIGYFIWYKVNGVISSQKMAETFWNLPKGSEGANYYKTLTVKSFPLTEAEFELSLDTLAIRFPCPLIEADHAPKLRIEAA